MPPRLTRPLARIAGALSALALGLLAACEGITGPDFPDGAERFTPPAQYAVWWRAVEACSGLRADFRRVRWYTGVVQSGDVASEDFRQYYAYWFADGNRIVLGRDPAKVPGSIVRHEMLHALIGPYQPEAHPRERFIERCGGVVACDAECAGAHATRAPTDSSPFLGAAALQRTLWVSTRLATPEVDDGWVSIVVRARNPYPFPIRVHAPWRLDPTSPPELFAYRIEATDREAVQFGGFLVGFEAGESKAFVFDRRVRGPRALPLGVHRVRAAVLGDSTGAEMLEVR